MVKGDSSEIKFCIIKYDNCGHEAVRKPRQINYSHFFCSKKCFYDYRTKHNKGAYSNGMKNPNWKGDNVGYSGVHKWVRQHKPKPDFCEECGIKPPYDLANISGEYKRDVTDYKWLCRKCHMDSEGRTPPRSQKGRKNPWLKRDELGRFR
jgi:hypothetical protein